MTEATRLTPSEIAERLSVRGLVQGIGFRPTVWCLAQQHNIRGSVTNNGDGVEIHACGSANNLAQFINALTREAPPLARVDGIVRRVAELVPAAAGFQIAASVTTSVHTGVVPDTATCAACLAEIFAPLARHFCYPFCAHCGPRLSII